VGPALSFSLRLPNSLVQHPRGVPGCSTCVPSWHAGRARGGGGHVPCCAVVTRGQLRQQRPGHGSRPSCRHTGSGCSGGGWRWCRNTTRRGRCCCRRRRRRRNRGSSRCERGRRGCGCGSGRRKGLLLLLLLLLLFRHGPRRRAVGPCVGITRFGEVRCEAPDAMKGHFDGVHELRCPRGRGDDGVGLVQLQLGLQVGRLQQRRR